MKPVAASCVPVIGLADIACMGEPWRSPDRMPKISGDVQPTVAKQQELRRLARTGQFTNLSALAREVKLPVSIVSRFVEL